jgi:eukaryotic-like serine/threonine-protein kinase
MNAEPDPPDVSRRCPYCGTLREPDAPEGLCPYCLLQLARDSAVHGGLDPESPLKLGEFADYELIAEIGHGGMGVVYQARQQSLDRIVALKMLLGGQFAEPSARARFRSEAEIAAQLQHQNIVAIHEVGEHDHLPFFTMDYVEGRSLAEVARDKPLTPAAAAGYLSIIARAIAYAHEHDVLHRDLKPSNILIDGSDQPRITDFGLAKRLTGSTTSLTLSGEALGSPNFMPPEQAAGRHKEIGPASDVYGLGAILYYLVTSRPPFVAHNLTAAVRQVQDQEPVSPRMLNPGVPKDLETICLKCLQKEPSKRYATAGDLADELDRFRRGEPIQARPVGPVGRTWRWCRRRPALATALVAVMVLAGVSTTAAVRMALAQGERERERYRANIQLAAARIEEGSIDVALATLLDCPERFRHWEWGYLVAQCHREVLTLEDARTVARSVTLEFTRELGQWRCGFSTDGQRVGAVHPSGVVQVWELPSGEPVWSLREKLDNQAGIVWFPDWSGVILARDNTVEIVRMEDLDQRLELIGQSQRISRMAIHPDGRRVAAIAADNSACIWDSANGALLVGFPVIPGVQQLCFDEGGGRLVVASGQQAAAYDHLTGRELFRMTGGPESCVAFYPDRDCERFLTLTAHGNDSTSQLRLWTTNGLIGDLGAIVSLGLPMAQFSPDRRTFFVSGMNQTAAVRDAQTGGSVFVLPSRVESAVFSPDGRRLATCGGTSTIHIWEPASRRELLRLKGHREAVADLAFAADGRLLASVSVYGSVKIWSGTPGREIYENVGLANGITHTSDGRKVINGFMPDRIVVRDTQSGQCLAELRRFNRLTIWVAISPDDRQLAAGDVFGEIDLWDLNTGQLQRTLRGHESMVLMVQYTRDGQLLVSYGFDGTVRVWDPETGRQLRLLTLEHPLDEMVGFSLSPDNRLLAVGHDRRVRIWDFQTGNVEHELVGHSEPVAAILFTPDGKRVISTAMDHTLRIWDVDSGQCTARWSLHGDAYGCAISPDGRRLALRVSQGTGFGSDAPTLEIWELESGRQLLSERGYIEMGVVAAFSPDGRYLVTDWWDWRMRQWEAFPWKDSKYPGATGRPLSERMRQYANRYWQERLEAERGIADTKTTRFVQVPFDRSVIPARDPVAPARLIDLTWHYTGQLDECNHLPKVGHYAGIDLRRLPKGIVDFNDVSFDVRGVIQCGCRSEDPLWWSYPVNTGPIPIDARFNRLHAVLGSVGTAPEGEIIGAFSLRYLDGTEEELEISYGRHVRHWWTHGDPRTDTDLARVAWEGSHGAPHIHPTRLRVFHAVWENTRPDEEIVSFDFVSKMTTTAAPFLIAVTLE